MNSMNPAGDKQSKRCSSTKSSKVLTIDTMNKNVKIMEYAVRGPLVVRAGQLEEQLKQGDKSLPFKNVILANIGDCHAVGQKPLTFLRQVLAGANYPEVLETSNMPSDVRARVDRILGGCRGRSLGSYTTSAGITPIREDVARYIEERDGGIPANVDDIFLCEGASSGIKSILKLLMTDDPMNPAGIMIPIPQYPLYTATIAEYGAAPIPYYLDENNKWGLNKECLEKSLAASTGCLPRAVVVINPGNPTGQVLSRSNVEDVIKFAKEKKLFILADEVYQHNVYAKGAQFFSFKRVLSEMGPEYSDVELASFMSTSKGFMGECGLRGGYCEIVNMDPEVKVHLLKFLSAKLCPNTNGQAVLGVVVNPPKEDEPSYELYNKEKSQVLGELKLKARMTTDILNSIPGVECNEVMGAMYAFPKIVIPQKAIDLAKSKNMQPDALFCFELLESCGICVVPGSGFGQMEGTYHFRMTILPPVEDIKFMLDTLKTFYLSFVQKYSS